MFIQGNENPILHRTVFQYLQIVRPCHAHFGSTFNVIASLPQDIRYGAIYHLVQKKAHRIFQTASGSSSV